MASPVGHLIHDGLADAGGAGGQRGQDDGGGGGGGGVRPRPVRVAEPGDAAADVEAGTREHACCQELGEPKNESGGDRPALAEEEKGMLAHMSLMAKVRPCSGSC